MIKYKVLVMNDGEYMSPFQNYNYGSDIIGRKMVCEDFDKDPKVDCGEGFYATDIEGLIYSLLKGRKVFEVNVGGYSVIYNTYKQRFSEQTFIRELPEEEVEELIKEQSDKMDWDYYHACYPVDPREIIAPEVDKRIVGLLRDWDSVGDSVGNSVWDSVKDSVVAYIGSLFPNTQKWKYIDHETGVYPFQSTVDLWHMGLVPSFDGEKWRLHAGKDMKVVFEITQKELRGDK